MGSDLARSLVLAAVFTGCGDADRPQPPPETLAVTDSGTPAPTDTAQPTDTATTAAAGFSTLVSGDGINCALTADGIGSCWGSYGGASADPPSPGPWEMLAPGLWHVCGMDPAGSLSCWGCDTWELGQCDPPAGAWAGLVSGSYHSCALDTEGLPTCWGCGEGFGQGQCDAPETAFVSLAAGTSHTCGLDADGAVTCWGCEVEDEGQCEASPGPWTQVRVGSALTCAIAADHTTSCWGRDLVGEGQVPDGGTYLDVAPAMTHTCAVDAQTAGVACWGCGTDELMDLGQCDGPTDTGYVQVGTGTGHSCGLRQDGTLSCWGCGEDWQFDAGQCDPPAASDAGG